jgi:hypothetical protein
LPIAEKPEKIVSGLPVKELLSQSTHDRDSMAHLLEVGATTPASLQVSLKAGSFGRGQSTLQISGNNLD